MIRAGLVTLGALLTGGLLGGPAIAQIAPAAPVAAPSPAPSPVQPAPQPPADLVRVSLATPEGAIVLALDRGRAPVSTANFLRYVDQRRLDGTAFYRAMKLADGVGLVQFGTRNDPKRTLPPIAHEPTSRTGLSHTDGAIALAMNGPGTAAGDFYIVVGDLRSLDAKLGDPGFAVFGHVVEGMDVVRRILVAPVSPTEGLGAMKGQMLKPRITVTTARRQR